MYNWRKISKYIRNIHWVLLLVVLFAPRVEAAEPWSFVVLCDNRAAFDIYRDVLTFIRELNESERTDSIPIDFVLACGDIDPVMKNVEIFNEVFQDKAPLYLPVMGNHEVEHAEDIAAITHTLLPGLGDLIVRHDGQDANYIMDWKGSRFIVLDQYSATATPVGNPNCDHVLCA